MKRVDPKWWVLLASGVGTFMAALDNSIANTILPVMSRAFNSNIATIEWVSTVYLLVVGGLLLSCGRFGDLRGHKLVYISGFVVFVTSSALCGLSPTVLGLIIFRALQGLGAAMLMATSPAILTRNFPSNQRGKALGIQAVMTYLGLSLGPSLGGWLAELLSWRVVFYMNVPIGLLGFWLSWHFIPPDPSTQQTPFDQAGAATFIFGLVTALLGLNQGHAWGWLSSRTLALFAASGLSLGAFLVIEQRVLHPLVDLSLFRRRQFSAAAASAVLNYICVFSILLLLPFYFIQGRGLSPAYTGAILTALPLVMAVVSPISGILSDKVGSRLPTTFGMTVLALGLFQLSQLGQASSFSSVAAALAVTGLGTGMFISPNNNALMGSAPPHQQGTAAGVLATARYIGMVLGVALPSAILSTALAHTQAVNRTVALLQAVDVGFLVATGAAILGIFVSAVRKS